MKTITLFDLGTGQLKRVLTLPDHAIERNVPEGLGVIQGRFDPLSQRVDLTTGAVVDYVPPQPDEDHEWRDNVINGRPRWVKKPEVVERELRVAGARREIERLESTQLRAMRELLIDSSNVEARGRLQEIEAAIAEKRKALS
jgi:hypothetical protein